MVEVGGSNPPGPTKYKTARKCGPFCIWRPQAGRDPPARFDNLRSKLTGVAHDRAAQRRSPQGDSGQKPESLIRLSDVPPDSKLKRALFVFAYLGRTRPTSPHPAERENADNSCHRQISAESPSRPASITQCRRAALTHLVQVFLQARKDTAFTRLDSPAHGFDLLPAAFGKVGNRHGQLFKQ